MAGSYAYQYVTAPVISSYVGITVTIANINQVQEHAIVHVATSNPPEEWDQFLAPESVQVATFELNSDNGSPLQAWCFIDVSSDKLVLTASIVTADGTQIYLPGDFAVFDVHDGDPGTRLW